jgi:hypothetical protein
MAASLGVKSSGVSWLVSELENWCGSVLVNYCCVKLVAETQVQFRSPEEGQHTPLQPLPQDW